MSKVGAVRIINLIVFCIWIALISILLYKNYSGAQLDKGNIEEHFGKKTYWYDSYVDGKRLGFAMTKFERAGDEIIIKSSRQVNVRKNEKDTILTEELNALTDLSYSIKSFQFSSHFKDEKGIKVTGKVEGEDIICFLEASDKSKRKTHRITTKGKDFYLPLTLIPVLHQKMPVPNKPIIAAILNPASLTNEDRRVVLEEIRPLKVGINVFNIYRFRVGDLFVWSNENGVVVKESYPTGITLYNSQFKGTMESPPVKILFDYSSLPFLKSNITLQSPETLKSLKVRIKGLRLNHQLYKDTSTTLDGDVLNIEKEDIEELKKKGPKLPYNKETLDDYIRADEWIKSDYEPLSNTGRIYARSYNNAFGFVNYLNGYLYTLIRTMPVFILVDSSDILKTLSGDYIERALMFATYSRSAGLPTRLIGGLVYLKGYFYYHVWPEVWFDKWVPVDPTFAQFPADVTHIPLRGGRLDEVVSIVDNLSNIEIEILEAS